MAGLTVPALIIAVAPAAAEAAEGAEDGNTGVLESEVEGTETPVSPIQQAEIAEANRMVEALVLEQRAELTQASVPTNSMPTTYTIPAARTGNYTVHAQRKTYTCGPASVRNALRVLNKEYTGTYSSPTEAKLEGALGTTTSGTGLIQIHNFMNRPNRVEKFGTWDLKQPTDKFFYLAYVRHDTYNRSRPLIQGVRTEHLGYYGNVSLNHFNVVKGYQRRDSGEWRIRMMDSWDPSRFNGGEVPPWYTEGNPYGHQNASLDETYHANRVSCPNCSDRRRLLW